MPYSYTDFDETQEAAHLVKDADVVELRLPYSYTDFDETQEAAHHMKDADVVELRLLNKK
jgi:hypothetical protein